MKNDKAIAACLIAGVVLSIAYITYFLNDTQPLCLATHPVAGEMCMVMEKPSSRLFSFLSIMFFLLFLLPVLKQKISSIHITFTLASLSAGYVAFSANHFLLRYIALELAAIWFLIELLLVAREDVVRLRQTVSAWVNLKIGDSGLLIAIFLLFTGSGSFIISSSLGGADGLDKNRLLLVIAGFILVISIKMGIWPLNWWMKIGKGLNCEVFTWFSRLLIPVLGGYLLYRISPLIQLVPGMDGIIFAVFSICALISVVWLLFQNDYAEIIFFSQSFGSSLGIFLAASGKNKEILFFLIILLTLRLIMDTFSEEEFSTNQMIEGLRNDVLFISQWTELIIFALMISHLNHFFQNSKWILMLWICLSILSFIRMEELKNFFHEIEHTRLSLKSLRLIWIGFWCWIGFSALLLFGNIWVGGGIHSNVFQFKQVDFYKILMGVFFAGLLFLIIRFTKKNFTLSTIYTKFRNTTRQISSRGKEMVSPKNDVFDLYPQIIKCVEGLMDSMDKAQDIFDQYGNILIMVNKGITWLHKNVEFFASEELWRRVQENLLTFARHLKKMHTGKIRINLIWVLVVLIILLFLVMTGYFSVVSAYC